MRNVQDGTCKAILEDISHAVGSQSAMSEENKNLKNIFKVWNVMTPTCCYHGNQSRYVTHVSFGLTLVKSV